MGHVNKGYMVWDISIAVLADHGAHMVTHFNNNYMT